MIKKLQKKLLKIQCVCAALLIIMAVILKRFDWMLALGCGAMVAILATLSGILFLRRMPEVIAAHTFYQLMIAMEVLKWFVVIAFTLLFLKRFQIEPLLMILGFAITYSSYFWIIKENRG